MRKIYRFFLLALFGMLSTQINAVVTTQDCNKHAEDVMITTRDKTQLRDEQYILLNNIIMKSCLSNIMKTNNTIENDENRDWFTEKILSGDTSKKDGNKRLKKLK
tara:strand:+ start:1747 stop:2061 length:315 start_codon:yes stop_codon:yes gene_type:complete